MPLLWSHAEFLKLLIAREHGQPVELLQSVAHRYSGHVRRDARVWHWRNEVPIDRLEAGRALRIQDRRAFTLHFGFNGWNELQERDAIAAPFGLWTVEFSAAELEAHRQIDFTRRYGDSWEGADHHVQLGHVDVEHAMEHVAPQRR